LKKIIDKFLSFDAILAETPEVYHMVFDFSVEICPGNYIDMVNGKHLQIDNAMALFTVEMVVGLGVPIIMVKSVAAFQTDCLPVFYQKVKVSVDSAKANVWKLSLHIVIHDFRSGMGFACHKERLNRFPLPAVSDFSHKHHSLLVIVIIIESKG